jgi:hypothetical protein
MLIRKQSNSDLTVPLNLCRCWLGAIDGEEIPPLKPGGCAERRIGPMADEYETKEHLDWLAKRTPGKLPEPTETQRLRAALARLWHDCLASDFNEHWDSYKEAQRILEN